MRHLSLALAIVAVVALPGCMNKNCCEHCESSGHHEDGEREVTVTMDQLPPAVQQTLRREAGGGRVVEIEQTTRDGKTAYEADVLTGGEKWEIVVLADGSVSDKARDDDDDDDEEDDDGKDD
jgi:hypothetical protein